MKIWQLVCGSVLVLSMTSCGNKEAATPPVEKTPVTEAPPATTGSAPAPEAPPATTGSVPAPEAPPATTGSAPAPATAPGTTASAPPVKKSPDPKVKTPAGAPTAVATGPGFSALKTIISTTKKAGEAANFDVATTEFSKFEDALKTVEDKVKTKKPAEYKAIETTVEAANMAIATKNKTALLGSLQKLSGIVDKVSK